MPKASKESAPESADYGVAAERTARFDGYTCNWVTLREPSDLAPAFAHLPTGRCECPHWGVVSKGRLTFTFPDHQEVVEAGEAFYVPPGHTPAGVAGTEFVMFSPSDLLAATDEALSRAMEAMQAMQAADGR